ncbi:uncharacterized protein [Epargyreus clarus]|uniref:uncharacterized protein n=1 Tax=Epargyreus clarus TaxID=520877 RepID=UPI003C2FDFF1
MDFNSQTKEITFISKFNVNNKSLYVQVFWKEDITDLFHMQLYYEDESWTGKYTIESATKRLQRLEETTHEYYSNIKECLNGNNKDFAHDFIINSDDINSANFTWKKRFEGALKTHGVVSLKRDEVAASKDVLIDFLLEQNKKLISDIDAANKTNNKLKDDLEECAHKLEHVIQNKAHVETTLYAQFVKVLNTKKERIRELKEHLKKYEPQ